MYTLFYDYFDWLTPIQKIAFLFPKKPGNCYRAFYLGLYQTSYGLSILSVILKQPRISELRSYIIIMFRLWPHRTMCISWVQHHIKFLVHFLHHCGELKRVHHMDIIIYHSNVEFHILIFVTAIILMVIKIMAVTKTLMYIPTNPHQLEASIKLFII